MRKLREAYGRTYAETLAKPGGAHGPFGLEHGAELKDALREAVSFSDLLVASKLRKEATGETVNKSGGLSINELVRRNPWFAQHRVVTSPLVEEKVSALVDAEATHLANMKRIRNLRPTKQLALARAEMLYRHVTSEVANVSEQVAMSVPEVGAAFPYGEYLTRDDARVRPTHKAMYGFIARRGHEIWTTIRPPCGFNCRCYVRWVAWPEAKRRGWAGAGIREYRLELRWPNSASKRNYDLRVFPDEGWRGPKIMSE